MATYFTVVISAVADQANTAAIVSSAAVTRPSGSAQIEGTTTANMKQREKRFQSERIM